MKCVSLVPLALLLLLATGTAGAQPVAPKAPPSPGAAQAQPGGPGQGDYRIGPEDMLQISVWRNEAMSLERPTNAAKDSGLVNKST